MSSRARSRTSTKSQSRQEKRRPSKRIYFAAPVAIVALVVGAVVYGSLGTAGGVHATEAGGVQTASVAVGLTYEPDTVYAKPGVPLQITFGQGGGCTAEIQFPQFGVFEDLTAGPKTISLPAMDPGEYQFACGMNMVFGKVVVR